MNTATIIDAANALLGRCDGAVTRDGAGFNGADAPFVNSLFSRTWLTEKQLAALHKLLKKYVVQLKTLGFDYATLVIPCAGPKWSATQGENKPSASLGKIDVANIGNTPIPVNTEPVGTSEVKSPPPAPSSPKPSKPWKIALDIITYFPPIHTPRPRQREAILKLAAGFQSGKRIGVLEMPTGGGKTDVCQCFARATRDNGGRVHFLTAGILLQDQYTRDFPAPEIETIKGRSNYGCTMGGKNAADAPCTAAKKGILPDCVEDAEGDEESKVALAVHLQLEPGRHLCPYWKQLQIAHDAPITLFNFKSFLFQQRIGRFGKRDLMIIDEGHNIEAQLMDYVTLTLSQKTLNLINVEIDRDITLKDQLMAWLLEKAVFPKISRALEGCDEDEGGIAGELNQLDSAELKKLQGQVESFLRYLDQTEWILETSTNKYGDRQIVARPLFAKDFAQDLLFRYADRILVMSATILDIAVWAKNLGLSLSEIEHVQMPCEFPVANRPIYLTYAGNCGFKTLDATKPRLAAFVANIIKKHEGQRGIIHTQSNHLAEFIMDAVHSPRFLWQGNFDGDKKAMLEAHAALPDSIIVAPAMHEGVDLKDDLGRFAILLKVPYPSTKDRVVEERMKRDEFWYAWLTALKIVQSIGRTVRSKDDWSTTYILDSAFDNFCSRNGRMIPSWVREAFIRYAPKEVRR